MNHKMPKPQNETKSLKNQGKGHFSIFHDTTPPPDNRKVGALEMFLVPIHRLT